jgi:hypothetical protein
MFIALIVVVVLVLAVLLALMGPTFGVFGAGNFRANKNDPEEKPPHSK